MQYKLEEVICCEQCWHSAERPCHQFVDCLSGLDNCHHSEECKAVVRSKMKEYRYEMVSKPVIFIGAGTCGLGAGAGKTKSAIINYLQEKGIEAKIVEVGCVGLCAEEPIVDIQMQGKARIAFRKVTADKVVRLLDDFFDGNINLDDVLYQYRDSAVKEYENVMFFDEHPFFRDQKRCVLENCGRISPTDIREYIANDGFKSLSNVLRGLTPLEVCDIIEKSGLRGRGGGGFLTGKKWKMAFSSSEKTRYLICNADEGDPGAFMDRAVIEGDPFKLIEGMAIASYAIGAEKAYVYIRAEYPLAIKHLQEAVEQCKAFGFLGENILDSGFSLDIIIKKGAGAFVCGEETALINSIEGKRGMPRPRPPYPTTQGLFGKPTVINNVETLANVPIIIRNGAEWFASLGTERSKGTKVFALSGNIRYTGLVEIEMGIKLRDIVYEIGGGIPNGKRLKAVQIGGPSGGCIPESHLDIEIDYESLKSVGAMMGSGGLVVMDEGACMVDVAKFFMDFIQRESCGKCIPCREGTKRMLEILERISSGRRLNGNKKADLERFQSVIELKNLAEVIKDTSLCGLGKSAPNPVLSTLRWFQEEYETHIFDRRCPSKVCKGLLEFRIDENLCNGCTLCIKACPSNAIVGVLKHPHHIIPEKCIGCGSCVDVCNQNAITFE